MKLLLKPNPIIIITLYILLFVLSKILYCAPSPSVAKPQVYCAEVFVVVTDTLFEEPPPPPPVYPYHPDTLAVNGLLTAAITNDRVVVEKIR